MMKWWKNRIAVGNQRGFTLIELMIVVAIIGILAAIAVPLYQNIQGRARTAKAQQDVRSIASAVVQYAAHCGDYPQQAGDNCTPGNAAADPVSALVAQQTNAGGQMAGPWFVAPGPIPPAGWCAAACAYTDYPITFPAAGTFLVTATPRNGDNGGNPVTAP